MRKRSYRKRNLLFVRTASLILPVAFAVALLSRTVFAKNTYVITDGDRVFTYSTFATDPMAVLDEAGLQLDENDSFTTAQAEGSTALTVQRSQTVYIDYYGEQIIAASFGETVEELLTRLNLYIDDGDTLSCAPDAEVYDGMTIQAATVARHRQTYTTTIDYGTVYCYDSAIPQGLEETVTPGVSGEMLCTADVTYVNGKETDRVVLTQKVTRQPVDAVVAIGTGEPTGPADPKGEPVFGEGTITLPTGEVLTYTHTMICNATSYCDKGITATGTRSRVGAIAVDPKVIPYGTRMFIVTNDGEYIYGIATAEDTGHPNHISGNRIDLFFDTLSECIIFGYRECTVYFLGSESAE